MSSAQAAAKATHSLNGMGLGFGGYFLTDDIAFVSWANDCLATVDLCMNRCVVNFSRPKEGTAVFLATKGFGVLR